MSALPKTASAQEAVFQQWLDRHMGLIWRIVRVCEADGEARKDLLQDTLLNLWSSIPSYRQQAKETTWIYRVALNTALVWRRTERRRREGFEKFLSMEELPRAQSSHMETLMESERLEQLHAAIRQLPKVDASLALLHLDGLSYQEMAAILGISENHVGVKLTRIRKQLIEHLKGKSHEF